MGENLKILEYLLRQSENEIIEFKEAKKEFHFDRLGEYFSAFSNEANLRGVANAWLVFGVKDNKDIVGTEFRNSSDKLQKLKFEIAEKTMNRITFSEILELEYQGKRVIIFKIPAAPKGMPISFNGHYFARNASSIVALDIEKFERIRSQNNNQDWSAEIILDADINDLDPQAILIARQNYKNKYNSTEVDHWDDMTFLNKAKITKKGEITRAAIILLGKSESEHLLSPATVQIRWLLKSETGKDEDYHIVSCPILLAVDEIYSKIRNRKYRYLKSGTLFPEEVNQYEPYVIREAINNCVAHQDYQKKGGMINVVEFDDRLVFTNYGDFIPNSVQKVIEDDSPEEHYRNRFLATAMFNLKMVDTAGGGIRKMYNIQRSKFFPLPDYDFADNKVRLTIWGKQLNPDYSILLAENSKLDLMDVFYLDKVQKQIPITPAEETILKSKNLITGRRPNYFISKFVADKINKKSDYTKNMGFEKEKYFEWIIKGLSEHSSLTRKDIDSLLWNVLPNWMNDKQKKIKINHLLTELSTQKNVIKNIGTAKYPQWVLTNVS